LVDTVVNCDPGIGLTLSSYRYWHTTTLFPSQSQFIGYSKVLRGYSRLFKRLFKGYFKGYFRGYSEVAQRPLTRLFQAYSKDSEATLKVTLKATQRLLKGYSKATQRLLKGHSKATQQLITSLFQISFGIVNVELKPCYCGEESVISTYEYGHISVAGSV
jgi:hypothetical protein